MDYLSPDCRLKTLTMFVQGAEPELMGAMIQRLTPLSEQMMLMSLTTTERLIRPFREKLVYFFANYRPHWFFCPIMSTRLNILFSICTSATIRLMEYKAAKRSQSNTTNCINLKSSFFVSLSFFFLDAMEENVILCNYNFSPLCLTVTGDVCVITRFTNVCLIGCD